MFSSIFKGTDNRGMGQIVPDQNGGNGNVQQWIRAHPEKFIPNYLFTLINSYWS
jgi:hypothetical protein